MIAHLIESIKNEYIMGNHIRTFKHIMEFDGRPESTFITTQLRINKLKWSTSGSSCRITAMNWLIQNRYLSIDTDKLQMYTYGRCVCIGNTQIFYKIESGIK